MCMGNVVRKQITIRKDQEKYLDEKLIALSPLVQRCIDKRMASEKIKC